MIKLCSRVHNNT